MLADLSGNGTALTLGIHSRIDATIAHIAARLPHGNIYVNRNMIGAVVGSQPFGGSGLSGWCVAAADKRHALWTLIAVAFAESSFFPIPPDAMLIPMSLARPDRAFRFAAWCTLASVVGGVVGYGIGALLYDSVGAWLIHLYGYGDKVEAFREAYAQWGAWIILLKGLTPIL